MTVDPSQPITVAVTTIVSPARACVGDAVAVTDCTIGRTTIVAIVLHVVDATETCAVPTPTAVTLPVSGRRHDRGISRFEDATYGTSIGCPMFVAVTAS